MFTLPDIMSGSFCFPPERFLLSDNACVIMLPIGDLGGSVNISSKRMIMKKVFVLAALIGLSTAAFAQQDDSKTKTEKAVDDTKAAGKKAGKEIKKDAKVVGEKTKDGAEAVGDGVEKGADKVAKGSKKAYKATKREAKEAKEDIKDKVEN